MDCHLPALHRSFPFRDLLLFPRCLIVAHESLRVRARVRTALGRLKESVSAFSLIQHPLSFHLSFSTTLVKLRPEIIIFPGVTVSKSAAARCWSSSSSRGAPPPSAVISAGSWVDSCLFMRVCATATSDHPFVLLTTKALSTNEFHNKAFSHDTGIIKQWPPIHSKRALQDIRLSDFMHSLRRLHSALRAHSQHIKSYYRYLAPLPPCAAPPEGVEWPKVLAKSAVFALTAHNPMGEAARRKLQTARRTASCRPTLPACGQSRARGGTALASAPRRAGERTASASPLPLTSEGSRARRC